MKNIQLRDQEGQQKAREMLQMNMNDLRFQIRKLQRKDDQVQL